MQYRKQMRETGKGNRFWQPTPLFTQHFTPKNFWEVKVMLYDYTKITYNTSPLHFIWVEGPVTLSHKSSKV